MQKKILRFSQTQFCGNKTYTVREIQYFLVEKFLLFLSRLSNVRNNFRQSKFCFAAHPFSSLQLGINVYSANFRFQQSLEYFRTSQSRILVISSRKIQLFPRQDLRKAAYKVWPTFEMFCQFWLWLESDKILGNLFWPHMDFFSPLTII